MSRNTPTGVTLVEMIIVLTLLGVLLAIALPRASAARAQLTVQSAAVQLHGDLVRARIDAVRRNQAVTFTKSSATDYTIQHIGVRSLPGGVIFATSAAESFVFPSFGPSASGGMTFDLQLNGYSRVVTLAPSGMTRIR